MVDKKELDNFYAQIAEALDKDVYDWLSNNFRIVERRLGVNIKAHYGDEDLFNKGQIFLFNHFARFETLIPPYIIHREAGAYCRTIADGGLFRANERLTKLLGECGAVPNDLPGLLPFLAAEILRGRKVIIFPEGGMIKDRRVIDDEQTLTGAALQTEKYLRAHRGAAVLALMLELFKRRIRDVCEANDTRRMRHWCSALGLASTEELYQQAQKPTLIVPGNITFYPIRIDDNIISKGMELLRKGLSERFVEELRIEGNLLLRDTDMDVRFGEPIEPALNWSWWERLTLRRYFDEVDSLADLFGLRETANRWTEKIFVKMVSRETGRLRDQYMGAIYANVTVNLAHLASLVITRLLENGEKEISHRRLGLALYLALKKLQTEVDINLHRGLLSPERYEGLVDGDNPKLRRFLATCVQAGLLEETQNGYRFLDKLSQEHDFHTVRVENPVLVSANEAAPIPRVRHAVYQALEQADDIREAELATHLFDDEERAYRWARKAYNKDRYASINEQETATRSGKPFLFTPDNGQRAKVGVLLIHGFLSSPAEMRSFGEFLSRQGFAVMGVRLAGHGTSPWDLHHAGLEDWQASIDKSYRILSAFAEKVVVIGFSAGGALALLKAAKQDDNLAGVASVCAPLDVHDRNIKLVRFVHKLNVIASWFSSGEGGLVPFYANKPENQDINYRNMPVSAINQFRTLMSTMYRNLTNVKTDALVMQADEDPVVFASSATKIFNKLASPHKKVSWLKSKKHGLILGNVGDTWQQLLTFIEQVSDGTFDDKSPEVCLSHCGEEDFDPVIAPVHTMLEQSAGEHPERICTDFMGKRLTYAQTMAAVDEIAAGLQQMGVKKGDRVGLCLPNSPYFVLAYYGALKAGATLVNFNPLYTADEIAYQAEDSGIRFMFTLDVEAVYPKVAPLLEKGVEKLIICPLSDILPQPKKLLFKLFKRAELANIEFNDKHVLFKDLRANGNEPETIDFSPTKDIALLQYTGGTTGKPKGAMLTHANVVSNTEQVQRCLCDLNPDGERFLAVLPFFHVFAMTVTMNLAIKTASAMVLMPRFELKALLKAIHKTKPTLFAGVPTIYNAINNYPKLKRYDLTSIRYCISGGAGLPSKVREDFEKLTGCRLVEGYGLSEASPVITCNPLETGGKAGSIGLPLPGTQVEIRSMDKPGKTVAVGERGEIVVRGPQVMAGYWKRKKDTAETLKNGWLRTGDVGYMDEDGYVFLTDRLKEVIITSGYNVYPRIIEEAFYRHKAVAEVSVIGIADAHKGEVPKAFVVLKPGENVSEEELLKHAASHLNPVEKPAAVELRDELPKTLIGKLSKKELIEEEKRKQLTRHKKEK